MSVQTHCDHLGVAAESSEGFTQKHRDGDGGTDLQDEQNQEQAEKSEHRHLRHTVRLGGHPAVSLRWTRVAPRPSQKIFDKFIIPKGYLTFSTHRRLTHVICSSSVGTMSPQVSVTQNRMLGAGQVSSQQRQATPTRPTAALHTFHTRAKMTCSQSKGRLRLGSGLVWFNPSSLIHLF